MPQDTFTFISVYITSYDMSVIVVYYNEMTKTMNNAHIQLIYITVSGVYPTCLYF